MRYNLGTIFRDLKIKHKLIIITSAVAIIVGLVSIAGYHYSMRTYSLLLYDQTANALNNFSSNLSGELEKISNLSSMIAVSSSVQNSLWSYMYADNPLTKNQEKSKLMQSIYQYTNMNTISISFILNDDSRITGGRDSTPESEKELIYIRKICQSRQGAAVWVASSIQDGSIICARQILSTGSTGFLSEVGFLLIRVDLEKITNKSLPRQDFTNSYIVTITDREENMIFPAKDSDHTYYPALEWAAGEKYKIMRYSGQISFIIKSNLYYPVWDITFGIPYDNVYKSIMLTRVLTILFILLAIIAVTACSGVVVQNISRQFHYLICKMDSLKAGNFDLVETREKMANDELGLLNQYFDEMTLEFKKMINDNYVKQLLIAKTQFKALEQQVNPHFLYNMLESIGWFARRCGEENIPLIVNALGHLLRYSLNEEDDVVSLEKELAIVDSYLQIQKIQLTDMLQVEYDIEQEALAVLIPKMTIQPLVDNAIKYSLEGAVDRCKLKISARTEESTAWIYVANNGSEIDVNILEKLKNNEAQAHGSGIGLFNIDSRIKLIFGEQFGLSFVNELDSAIVRVKIPRNYRK